MPATETRPFVYLNYACSADGKISSVQRDEIGFGSRRDKERMDQLRAEADVVLVGAATLRTEDPDLRVADPARRRARVREGRDEQPLRAVVSGSLDLPAGSRFFSGRDRLPLVLTTTSPPPDRLRRLADRAEIVRAGSPGVDLKRALETLRGRGVRRLLAEGGGTLNAALFEAGLVDEIYMTLCPLVLGGRTAPTPVDGAGLGDHGPVALRLSEFSQHADEIFCRYVVVRKTDMESH